MTGLQLLTRSINLPHITHSGVEACLWLRPAACHYRRWLFSFSPSFSFFGVAALTPQVLLQGLAGWIDHRLLTIRFVLSVYIPLCRGSGGWRKKKNHNSAALGEVCAKPECSAGSLESHWKRGEKQAFHLVKAVVYIITWTIPDTDSRKYCTFSYKCIFSCGLLHLWAVSMLHTKCASFIRTA